MPADAFDSRRSGFEVEYFHKQDQQVVEKLKAVFERKLDREGLKKYTGVTNEEVLDRLIAVNVKGELLLVFRLYPLVEIAWADGAIDARETKAVLDAAMKQGVPAGGTAIATLEAWLKRGPTPDGRKAWFAFADELRKTLSPEELAKFRDDLLEGAKAVAKASGGILGVAFEISASEKKVLDGIAKHLS